MASGLDERTHFCECMPGRQPLDRRCSCVRDVLPDFVFCHFLFVLFVSAIQFVDVVLQKLKHQVEFIRNMEYFLELYDVWVRQFPQ